MNLCSRPAVFVSACACCDVAWPAASCEHGMRGHHRDVAVGGGHAIDAGVGCRVILIIEVMGGDHRVIPLHARRIEGLGVPSPHTLHRIDRALGSAVVEHGAQRLRRTGGGPAR